MKNSATILVRMSMLILIGHYVCILGMDAEKMPLTDDCWIGIFNQQSTKEQLNLASCCTYLRNLHHTRSTIASPIINTGFSISDVIRIGLFNGSRPTLNRIKQKIKNNQITGTLTIKRKDQRSIIPAQTMVSIIKSLETNTSITELDFSSCNFTHDEVPHFIDSYVCRKVLLKKIVLTNTSKNNPLDCLDVYLILKSVPTLEELSYSNHARRSPPFTFSYAQKAILNNEQLAPLGEQLMQLKKLCLRNLFLNAYGCLRWLTDALKKNTHLEELDLQNNLLFLNINGIDWNMGGIREAADQPDSPLKILDLRYQDTEKAMLMIHIPPYQPKRSTLTILL